MNTPSNSYKTEGESLAAFATSTQMVIVLVGLASIIGGIVIAIKADPRRIPAPRVPNALAPIG